VLGSGIDFSIYPNHTTPTKKMQGNVADLKRLSSDVERFFENRG
jgi:hypothetical protein